MGIYVGSAGNDTITPFSISGGVTRSPPGTVPTGGADTLSGGNGNDSLDGGGGADLVVGGAGNDTLIAFIGGLHDGGDDNDRFLVVSAGAGTSLNGGSGQDVLDPSGPQDLTGTTISGIETLALDASPLTMTIGQLDEFVFIIADGGATTATINLSVSGFASGMSVSQLTRLTVNASAGDDVIFFDSGATPLVVNGGLGDDDIETDVANDTLNGGAGNDTLDGEAGADLLNGGDGDDLLVVQEGDSANGGNDDDRFELDDPAYALATTLDGGDGIDELDPQSIVTLGALVTLTNIENLLLDDSEFILSTAQLESFTRIGRDSGTTGDLVLTAGGAAKTEVGDLESLSVTGSAEDEALTFTTYGTLPTAITVDAGGGNDTISTGEGADSLAGGAGNDSLRSSGGNDTIFAEGGDRANGGDGDDLIFLSGDLTLATTISGGAGADTLDPLGSAVLGPLVTLGGIENLALDAVTIITLSTAQLNVFTRIGPAGSSSGSIVLSAGGSATTEVAGLQTLSVIASGENEKLTFTQPGTEPTAIALSALGGDDTIQTGNGADGVDGGEGNDALASGAGRDTLVGGLGADTLNGGDGRDLVIGGVGADNLRGGQGADIFLYEVSDGSADTIADFIRGSDLLRIDAGGFGGNLVAGPLAADRLVVHDSNAATGAAGTGQFVFNTATARLFWDPDGSGAKAGEMIARLTGVTTLSTSDFDIIA